MVLMVIKFRCSLARVGLLFSMAAIFIVCSCGYPNALGGPSESLLETITYSTAERKCGSCGEALNNSTAFIGEWERDHVGRRIGSLPQRHQQAKPLRQRFPKPRI